MREVFKLAHAKALRSLRIALFSFKVIEVFGKAVLDEGGAQAGSRKGAKDAKNCFVSCRPVRSLVRRCWMREVLKLAHAKAPRALRV
jgi:hypothetical protein